MRQLLLAGLLLVMAHSHAAAPMVINVPAAATTFSVVLPSNPTTGYRWSLTRYDKHLLKLVSSQYTAAKTRLIGAGGSMTFYFRLVSGVSVPPDTSLVFHYARPWESDQGEPRTVTVRFQQPNK